MRRSCLLVVLMLLSLPAYAGDSISFVVGGRRVEIDASRHCRSTSCASVSVSGVSRNRDQDDRDADNRDDDRYDDRYRDNRYRDDRRSNEPTRALQLAPQTVAPSAPPVGAAPPPTVYSPAAATTQSVPAPPPARLAVPPAPPPPAPPPAVAKPVEPVRPAPVPQISRVSNDVDEGADAPVGDWQTEGKGSVRIAKCGNALCGYVLSSSSNDKGEAVLINMKPKSKTQWTGNVYSHGSGDTYYGTMDIKGPNTLRVEACALGRFYCSGNNWSRIDAKAESLMSSRKSSAEPRS
jgi:hypothetical protein